MFNKGLFPEKFLGEDTAVRIFSIAKCKYKWLSICEFDIFVGFIAILATFYCAVLRCNRQCARGLNATLFKVKLM
jgi:hypothetical protein